MDKITEFLQYLNQYSAGITAIATVAIAFLSFYLAKENRLLRKAGTEPEIVAYLTPTPNGSGGIDFIIANIGQGPAREVNFKFECNEDDFEQHNVLLRNHENRAALSVLPQGERLVSLFGIGYVLVQGNENSSHEMLKPFKVKISYKGLDGKEHQSVQNIDISQFSGLRGIFSKPSGDQLIDIARTIEKHLGKISKHTIVCSDVLDTTEIAESFRTFAAGKPIKPNKKHQ
ncbi:hypothetical protein [Aestuariispira ectoiniformans]|uniref:hypothetical protein n=1 Tax=Aestuariispira ectoiniformans TaxID=2775080 RepID=UPI00223BB69A|nr:hypothetical protein [Aestuariispira ectoiniformans]